MQSKNEQITSLIELNEELENYFSNTIIPQLFVDANLILRKFTPPAMKQFKLELEFLGKPMEEIQENFRYPTIIDNIKAVIATGKILEKEIQTTDMGWYQMNILPYRVLKENKTNGVIITFVDITARIRDLKEQEKLIAEHELLLDTIAHDIKNPILGLSLTIQMLKKLPEKSMEKFPVLLNNVESGLIAMKKVISELIDSRWEKQRQEASAELLDIGNILEDVRLTLAPQILESGAIIRQDIRCPEITFIRRKLRSVIYNLLSNAIKYCPADRNPEIMVKCSGEKEFVVISITDNGIGMSPEEQKSVFEKFQRVKMNYEGYGVGLYLVNTVVTAAGGKIELESTPGQGSEFKVYLKHAGGSC
ncbi:sensor histidine kinase [Pedobacter frigoris]|uniref:histidine kinase n=1 Tax=Pedobacter frigoris TaxID=2571272 RepID=A0A4U1CQ06_9SPHI|nr:ATP-binding protein [Pedobacter frigoris]TKC08885.1 GHKL domain-containing protein [Pedobacter frigoris]